MSEDEWLKEAMADDAAVANMLLRLSRAPPPPQSPVTTKSILHLGWTVRQRRTKPTLRHGDEKKKAEPARLSPTTPLSWSGGTSVSGGVADGFEESSRPAKPSHGPRSKGLVLSFRVPDRVFAGHRTGHVWILVPRRPPRLDATVTSEATTLKRPRKKKSLAELKEEETLLLKERRNLKNELANLRLTLEKQRAENESLKRIKLDFQSQPTMKATTSVAYEEAIADRSQQTEEAGEPASVPGGICNPLGVVQHTKLVEVRGSEESILLPDLNLPFEEDHRSGIL